MSNVTDITGLLKLRADHRERNGLHARLYGYIDALLLTQTIIGYMVAVGVDAIIEHSQSYIHESFVLRPDGDSKVEFALNLAEHARELMTEHPDWEPFVWGSNGAHITIDEYDPDETEWSAFTARHNPPLTIHEMENIYKGFLEPTLEVQLNAMHMVAPKILLWIAQEFPSVGIYLKPYEGRMDELTFLIRPADGGAVRVLTIDRMAMRDELRLVRWLNDHEKAEYDHD